MLPRKQTGKNSFHLNDVANSVIQSNLYRDDNSGVLYSLKCYIGMRSLSLSRLKRVYQKNNKLFSPASSSYHMIKKYIYLKKGQTTTDLFILTDLSIQCTLSKLYITEYKRTPTMDKQLDTVFNQRSKQIRPT
jgi:hypothetical protein